MDTVVSMWWLLWWKVVMTFLLLWKIWYGWGNGKLANPSMVRDKFSVFVEMISEELKYFSSRQQIYTNNWCMIYLWKVWWWWKNCIWKFRRDCKNRWGIREVCIYINIYKLSHFYTNIDNSPIFVSNVFSDIKFKHSLRMVNKSFNK